MLERWLGHKKTSGPEAGSPAPDFSLETIQGERFTLSQSLGKGPVVVVFFKVSCPVCQFTFPFLERIHQAYRDEAATIGAVSQDNPEKSRRFGEKFGVTFPIAIDGAGFPVSKSYGFASVPTIFLIGGDGRVRLRFSGFSKAGLIRLSEEIASLVSGPAAPVFQGNERVPELRPG